MQQIRPVSSYPLFIHKIPMYEFVHQDFLSLDFFQQQFNVIRCEFIHCIAELALHREALAF